MELEQLTDCYEETTITIKSNNEIIQLIIKENEILEEENKLLEEKVKELSYKSNLIKELKKKNDELKKKNNDLKKEIEFYDENKNVSDTTDYSKTIKQSKYNIGRIYSNNTGREISAAFTNYN